MNPLDIDSGVAAAVAAAGTFIGALAQIRVALRKDMSDRARGMPATKKLRRGPILALFLLLIAAAAGGFAFSQYLERQSDRESAAMRGQLETELTRISATAERLERATLIDHGSSAHMVGDHGGTEDVTVTTTLGPCRASAGATGEAAATCSEQQQQRVTLCGSVPSSAVVTTTVLYARPEQSRQPWAESRVVPGQDIGHARFADKPFERSESEKTKQVCTVFSDWDGEQAYTARLVVNFLASPAEQDASPPAELDASRPAVVQISDVAAAAASAATP